MHCTETLSQDSLPDKATGSYTVQALLAVLLVPVLGADPEPRLADASIRWKWVSGHNASKDAAVQSPWDYQNIRTAPLSFKSL